MAAAIATTTSAAWSSGGSATETVSVTRAAGEGFLLGLYYEYDFGWPDTPSSVVWDAAGDNQALTLIDTQQMDINTRYVKAYYLAAPTSAKTANITVTFTGTTISRSGVIVRHITGHDTSSMIRASAKSSGDTDSTPFGPTVSSAAGDLVVDMGGFRVEEAYVNADTGQADVVTNSLFSTRTMMSSSKGGAGTVDMKWYHTEPANPGRDIAIIATSIKSAAVATPVNRALLLGVG